MKTKPILIASAIAVVIISSVLFILYGRSPKVNNEEGINRFLATFNNYVNNGQTDSLLTCFEADSKNNAVVMLANVLTGKSGGDGAPSLAKVEFKLDENTLVTLADGTVQVTLQSVFTHGELLPRHSTLVLKIAMGADYQYKIVQADARQFLTDYVAFENFVRTSTLKDEDIYDPLTLKAFAAANQLKTRFDSVIWFSRIQGKTYYYVVNGKWQEYDLLPEYNESRKTTYKMGLVGPDMGLIIQPMFDLIHKIGDIFPDLVEVESNQKKGFYDLNGRERVPVVYDQIFPVDGEGDNIAVLRKGDDYFWLKSDYTISEKADIQIADILPKLKKGGSFNLSGTDYEGIIEHNSRDEHDAIYLAPSYLVDLNLLPVYKSVKNPLRRQVQYEGVTESYNVTKNTIINNTAAGEEEPWWQTALYSIRDHFLGGRSEFYNGRNLIIADKRHNRIYATEFPSDVTEFGEETLEGPCDINSIRELTDSLFEVKVGTVFSLPLYDTTKVIAGGPCYYYLKIKGNKLIRAHTNRTFAFTKFIKMDDSYLNSCYLLETFNKNAKTSKRINILTPEILKVIKNEIYADYGFEFKDKRWEVVFGMSDMYNYNDEGKITYSKNVEDSLTAIDKYNINFIDQKLSLMKPNTMAAK